MNYFKVIIDTNITLSLAATFLAAGSAVQFGVAPDFPAYLILIFFGTFLAYNIHHIYALFQNKNYAFEGFSQWINQHKLFFCVLMGLSAIGFCWASLFVNKNVQLALTCIAMISVLYSFPVFRFKDKRFGLRDLPFVKIFLIVLVWSVATVLLPALQLGLSVTPSVQLVFIERAIFLFALALLFDIRDLESDTRNRLVTIPRLIGKSNSFLLANMLLVVFLTTSMNHYTDTLAFVFPALVISGASTFVFILYTKIRVMPYFHYRVFDGTLLFQPLLVFVFYYLDKGF